MADNFTEISFIPLTGHVNRKKVTIDYAIVDSDDFEKLIKYSWWKSSTGYAYTTLIKNIHGIDKNYAMHRMIMNVNDCESIDHINRNKLSNSKLNLRMATLTQNNRNDEKISSYKGKETSSKYVGVYQHKNGKWCASCCNYRLGYYIDEKDAAKARDWVAYIEYGEFAYLNFPNELSSDYAQKKEKLYKSSQYNGVIQRKNGYWEACMWIHGKTTYLNRFKTEIEAALSYDAKLKELGGDLKKLNFPD